jgi:hypothetical protein
LEDERTNGEKPRKKKIVIRLGRFTKENKRAQLFSLASKIGLSLSLSLSLSVA